MCVRVIFASSVRLIGSVFDWPEVEHVKEFSSTEQIFFHSVQCSHFLKKNVCCLITNIIHKENVHRELASNWSFHSQVLNWEGRWRQVTTRKAERAGDFLAASLRKEGQSVLLAWGRWPSALWPGCVALGVLAGPAECAEKDCGASLGQPGQHCSPGTIPQAVRSSHGKGKDPGRCLQHVTSIPKTLGE